MGSHSEVADKVVRGLGAAFAWLVGIIVVLAISLIAAIAYIILR